MDKIDIEEINRRNLPVELKIAETQVQCIERINKLVEEWNSHKEWHRRFFDKYNKAEEMTQYEDKE